MICQGEDSFLWVLLAAAFYEGNPVTFVFDEAMDDFLTAAEEKHVTVIYSENFVLKNALQRTEKKSPASGCLRMLITETFWEGHGRADKPGGEEIEGKWHTLAPYVPVNGQGHEGSFCYDCEWY